MTAALLLTVTGCAGSSEPAASPAPAASAGGSFSVSIEHQFGTTTIPAAPTRVVAIGFDEQDYVLAFGVTPVGVREFLGYHAPNRPWHPRRSWAR